MKEEYRKALRRSMLFSICWMILILMTGTASTYAWFSFTSNTNITPMSGKISEGNGADLLISEKYDGPFGTTVVLHPEMPDNSYTYTDPSTGLPVTVSGELIPVSTPDLAKFYEDISLDRDEVVRAYQEVENPKKYYVHGTFYLTTNNDTRLYFDPEISFATDQQTLAALRMGMRITDRESTETYIFSLESLISDWSQVKSMKTVDAENVVVGGLNGYEAVYSADPSQSIAGYFSGNEDAKELFAMKKDTVVTVEYWIYLEGCDEHCFNPVAGTSVGYQLVICGG